MNYRAERVNSLIHEELSKIIMRELELPALATLTNIDTSIDLNRAVVKISVLPLDKADAVLGILNHNIRHLEYLLMKKINIKPMPRIVFKIDYGIERAANIEKIFIENKINK